MTPSGEEDEEKEPEEDEVEVEVEETPRSWESLRESLHKTVDDALREFGHMKGRGRHFRHAMAGEMHRIRHQIADAFRGAAGAVPFDINGLKKELRGRANTVMTRVKDEDLERLDLLVDAGLFESRSECAAFLIHAGLDARSDLVDKVQNTAKKIAKLKEQLQQDLSGDGENA